MVTNIVAIDEEYGIGLNNDIPWDSPEDRKLFKKLTTNNVVIMGRKTLDSIGKPLPNRINCVISSKEIQKDNILHFYNPLECYLFCKKKYKDKTLFVIGGQSIYKWFLENNLVDTEIITFIKGKYNCNVYYPKFYYPNYTRSETCIIKDINIIGKIMKYKYNNFNENQLINIFTDILYYGENRKDRTGVGSKSIFGRQLQFNLENSCLPLITHRRLFTRGVFEELMLFINGDTNTKKLEDKGVNVWKPNTTKEFLQKRNLDLPEGDMGHSYGFSFRHFGANYKDMNEDYNGKGFDQIKYVINEIKTNPTSRRLLISLWEPNNMHKAALPPCLYNYQFYVQGEYLSCMMTQRSSDVFLAGGWNIATGSLLTYFIAYYTNLKPSQLIWNMGDIHIYNNNIEEAENFISSFKNSNLYPSVFLQNMPDNIEDIKWENVKIVNYNPMKKLKLKLNA